MEFVFQRGLGEITGKALVAWRRLAASWQLIRRSRVYHLYLGRDHTANSKTVTDFLRASKIEPQG